MEECGGCGKPFDAIRGALSRYDNKTMICSDCGSEEGMAQYVAQSYNIDPKAILFGAGKIDWLTLAGGKEGANV